MIRSNGLEALFVGRGDALQALEAAFDSLSTGRGGMVALYGEPGIGKTACAEVFARHIEGRGGLVLWGRCLEQAGAPPYWPWTQILRDYVDASSRDELQARLGGHARMLASLLPELEDRLDITITTAGGADQHEQRVRLFEAVSRTLARAAAEAPLTLIIDDLHWADASSLSLLEYLCDEARRHRLLIVCAYRDIEVTRKSPLLATLGALAHARHLQRVRLGGLDLEETGQLAAAVAGGAMPAQVVQAIYQQTDGNPLFVHEVARVVADELRHRRGDVIAVDVPDGVREAIGRRLDRLSRPCNELLSVASVIGREFDLPLAASVLGQNLEAVLPHADEAIQGGILEPVSAAGRGLHRFAHALIRETLQDEIPTLDRLRIHKRIAAALEALHPVGDDVLSMLVHHACEAAALGDCDAAVDLALRAAERDVQLLALEEASRHCDLALRTLSVNGHRDDRRIAAISFRKAEIDLAAGHVEPALNAATRGAEASRGRDPVLFSQNVQIMVRIASNASQAHAAALLEEALAALPDSALERRSAILAHLAVARRGGDPEFVNAAAEEAVALARRLQSPDALMMALRLWAQGLRGNPATLSRRLALCREALALLPQCRDAVECAEPMYFQLLNLMEAGAMAESGPLLCRYIEQAEALGLGRHRYQAGLMEIALRLLRGEWAGLEPQLEASLQMGQRLDRHDPDGVYGAQMFQLNRELGRITNLAPLVRRIAEAPEQRLWRPGLAVMCVEAGLPELARAAFEPLAADDFAAIPRDDMWLASAVFCADVCAALGDGRRAARLYDLLTPYAGQAAVHPGAVCYGAVEMQLGLLAECVGDAGRAIAHLRGAVRLCCDMQAWPALARSQAELGRLLLASEPEEARRLLMEAEQIAARLGMAALSARVSALLASEGRRLPDGLTMREADVLKLLAMGRSNKDISRVLGISLSTVATHVRSILEKTGCANRTEAAAYAIREQLN
ncbi:MAG: AAA family ATPase [Pseudomonadales bacterium]